MRALQLGLGAAFGAVMLLAAIPARAAPMLEFSATIGTDQDPALPETCHVWLQVRNNARETVALYGRVEGLIGQEAQPSFRPMRFDAVQPGRFATDDITFDGNCSRNSGPNRAAGQVIIRGFLVCRFGLNFREDCPANSATRLDATSGRPPVEVRIEVGQ